MRVLQHKATAPVVSKRTALRVRAQAPEATVTPTGNVVTEAGKDFDA